VNAKAPPLTPAIRPLEDEPHSLRDFLTIVFKRQRLIVAFFVTTVVVVTLGTFLTAPTYEATASILVKKASAEVPLVPSESSQLIISQVTPEDLNSEVAILKSRAAIEDALRSLGVDESWRDEGPLARARRAVSQMLGAPRLSYFDEMVLHLEKQIEVEAVRKSNVLQVSYRHKDPVQAQKVVAALTERYISQRSKLYGSPGATTFFDEETRAAATRLKGAEQALKTYSSEAGVSVLGLPGDTQSLAAEKEATLQRLADFEKQLGEARVAVRQQTERVAALERQLAAEPPRLRSAARLNQDPTTEELEKALVTLQLQRDALIQDYKPTNRRVRDLDEQIRVTQERLAAADSEVASINKTEVNPVHQELKGTLLAARADLTGAHARYASLESQVRAQRQRLDELSQTGLTTDALRREARAAEQAYMLYQKKHEEARISAAMDKTIVNVSLAQPAELPLRPIAPRKALNLLLALILGVAGGLGLAFVAEYFDHSFTTGHDLESRLGIPLLGAIPDQDAVRPMS
jgi:uncharacterized protein involved in exopolysaccharide biosynthesis